jgi:hypothetical protein
LAEANARFERQDFAEAVALIDGVTNPTPEMTALAAKALYAMGQYGRAAIRFEQAARAEPSNPEHREWAAWALEASRVIPATSPSPSSPPRR